jgi:hypothetical protein
MTTKGMIAHLVTIRVKESFQVNDIRVKYKSHNL